MVKRKLNPISRGRKESKNFGNIFGEEEDDKILWNIWTRKERGHKCAKLIKSFCCLLPSYIKLLDGI